MAMAGSHDIGGHFCGSGLTEDGWIERREDIDAEDLYYFGYGTDYLGCLKDYYKLTGATPILQSMHSATGGAATINIRRNRISS